MTGSLDQRPHAVASPRFPWALIFGLVAVATGAAFGWTLDGHFVRDDFGFVGRFFDYPLARWPAMFTHGWADGLWSPEVRELRPQMVLTFIIDGKFWGINPAGYRLTNLLLHALAAVAVGAIAWRVMARDRGCAAIAALLFALHPVTAEPVTWITGRDDILATLFELWALVCLIEYRAQAGLRWLIGIVLLQAAAIFSKESGLTLMLLLLAADVVWLRPAWRRPVWAPYAGCVLVLFVYFACRSTAFEMGGIAGIGDGLPDPAQLETYSRFGYRQLAYLSRLFPPVDTLAKGWLAADGFRAAGALCGLALATASLAFVMHRWWICGAQRGMRREGVFFGAAWYLVGTVPLIMTYFSARHLYLAAAGLAVFIVLVLRCTLPARRHFLASGAAIVCFFAVILTLRVRAFHDAAIISKRLSDSVAGLERETSSGAVFFNMAEFPDWTFGWAWAVPYALRPPFTHTALDMNRPVLAPPALFAFQGAWPEPRTLDALAGTMQDGWLLQVSPEGEVRRIAVPPEKIRQAVNQLRVNAAAQPALQAWRRFVSDLNE